MVFARGINIKEGVGDSLWIAHTTAPREKSAAFARTNQPLSPASGHRAGTALLTSRRVRCSLGPGAAPACPAATSSTQCHKVAGIGRAFAQRGQGRNGTRNTATLWGSPSGSLGSGSQPDVQLFLPSRNRGDSGVPMPLFFLADGVSFDCLDQGPCRPSPGLVPHPKV